MRSVTLTLSEDDLYRLSLAMHAHISSYERLAKTAPTTADRIRRKYVPVLGRVQAAYQECLKEENHVGREDTDGDYCGL